MKIKFNFKGTSLMMFFVAMSSFVFAQRTVTGSVTDAETNESLIGASVVVTGTTKGTLTDVDGKYTLTDVPANATSLTFSFTGYSSLTVNLGTSNVVDAKLNGGEVLEQLVVIGYGSVKKSDATGAVSAITEKDFNKGVIVAPEQLLQGRVAGVQIASNSGEPGGAINIRIRGTSSVRGGNNPLFVIDGVPLAGDDVSAGGANASFGSSTARNPLNFLNPNDIERVDVLKDASATAIYGARGANGVVLITTKKGASGKGSLDYGYSLGVSQITKKYDLLDAATFKANNPAQNLGGETDWQNEVFQTGLAHNHNLSYGAGDAKGAYRFSLGYLDQDGIVKNSGITKYTGRFNADRSFINDRLKVGVQATVSNIRDRSVPITDNGGFEGDLLGNVLKANPTMPIYKAGTDTFTQISTAEPNPMAILAYSKDRTNTIRALVNFNAELKIAEGLTFKTVYGADNSLSSRKAAYSGMLKAARIEGKGRAYAEDIQISNKVWENFFTYTKKMDKVDLTALAGYSYQSFDRSGKSVETYNFPSTYSLDQMTNNMGAAQKSVVNNSFNTKDELQSYFARAIVGYDDKYLVTLSYRRDGSTKFAADNRSGNFISFAGKWRLIQESFIPKNIFSDLALRVGYGVTGNQEIPHDVYNNRSRYSGPYIDNDGNIQGVGSIVSLSFNNPILKWEETKQSNIGLDFGFMDNKLSGSVDFYDKHTDGLLFQVENNGNGGGNAFQWQNLDADVQNRGVDLALNFIPIKNNDLSWTVNFNMGYNKNLVKELNSVVNTGVISGQGLTGAYAQQIAAGQPLFAFYLRPFGGFDANGNSIYPDGDYQQFLDGKSALPTMTGGITNTVTYKGFDASVQFNGVFGNYIYSNTANAFFTQGAFRNGRNVTKDVLGNGEGALNAPDVSTRFLEKGDFVRLSNLNLGYNLKTGNANISNIRLFVVGQNLLTFTKYSGQDPEVSTNKAIDGVPSFGIDYTAFPRARTWTIGANVSF